MNEGILIKKRVRLQLIVITTILVLLMYPYTYRMIKNFFMDLYVGIKINLLEQKREEKIRSNNRTFVAIMFDSGYESVYENVFSILKEKEFTGSVGIIPSLLNEAGYMDYNQISTLYVNGWDVVNQTYHSKANMYYKSEELLEDIQRAKKWMDLKYLKGASDRVIIPYGELNPYLIPLLKEKGFISVRTSDNIILLQTEEIMYYDLKVLNVQSDHSADMVIDFIQNGNKNNKDVLIIFNKIEESSYQNTMSYPISEFKEIIDYIDSNDSKYQVVNYTDLQ